MQSEDAKLFQFRIRTQTRNYQCSCHLLVARRTSINDTVGKLLKTKISCTHAIALVPPRNLEEKELLSSSSASWWVTLLELDLRLLQLLLNSTGCVCQTSKASASGRCQQRWFASVITRKRTTSHIKKRLQHIRRQRK